MLIITRAVIEELFKTLDTLPGFAAKYNKYNWSCCQSCGRFEIEEYCESAGFDADKMNVLFCYQQDVKSAFGNGKNDTMKNDLYIVWSGNGQAICDAIKARGFEVEWNGDPDARLAIKVK
jgi:hypothetical protein